MSTCSRSSFRPVGKPAGKGGASGPGRDSWLPPPRSSPYYTMVRLQFCLFSTSGSYILIHHHPLGSLMTPPE